MTLKTEQKAIQYHLDEFRVMVHGDQRINLMEQQSQFFFLNSGLTL